MNLLTDPWIPVRQQTEAAAQKLTLQQLLCKDEHWELCLPRDDMELAALQLLICLTQILFHPKDTAELKQRIQVPLSRGNFDQGCAPYQDWFQLDHLEYPFMQVKAVRAEKITNFYKLLTGLASTTNSCFVNASGLGDFLCGSCASIVMCQHFSGHNITQLFATSQRPAGTHIR